MEKYEPIMLKINLDNQDITKEKKTELAKKYIGGRGLGTKLLFEETPKNVDPLGSGNPLIIATGPYTGLPAPGSAFFSVITKSPLTRTCVSSHSGGKFGPFLRKSGVDVVFLEGSSETPLILLLKDGKAMLKRAGDLWGKDVFETTEKLEKKFNGKVLTIGRAGENQVLISAVMADKYRAAARGGVGAVMGSKKLKAIIVSGDKQIKSADPQKIDKLREKGTRRIKENAQVFSKYGTSIGVDLLNNAYGSFPTKNWKASHFDEADKISGERLVEKYKKKDVACYSCPIACSNYNVVKKNGEIWAETEGPEYETLYSLGSNCLNSDLSSIIKMNEECNNLGIDTISMGGAIAHVFEAAEKGYLEKKQENVKLEWGDAKSMLKMIRATAEKKDIGKLLAKGVKKISEKLGTQDFAMHVKGLELPGHDARVTQGMALSYGTSNRGACHLRSMMYTPELITGELDPSTIREKAEHVIKRENSRAVLDSMLICKIVTRDAFSDDIGEITEAINAAAGYDLEPKETLQIGERIYELERKFNAREGFKKQDDMLPNRLHQIKSTGPSEGRKVNAEEYMNELQRYYEIRGWFRNGTPKNS